jgi:hypothetical protein
MRCLLRGRPASPIGTCVARLLQNPGIVHEWSTLVAPVSRSRGVLTNDGRLDALVAMGGC